MAWDLTNAVYENKSFDPSSQNTDIGDSSFSDDGTKLYILGLSGFVDVIYQYSLSTAWDVSTATYDSKSFSVTPQESSSRAIFFKDDGAKMYVGGHAQDKVFEYSLSNPWDVSTASFTSGDSFDVSTQDTDINAIYIKPDGTKMYFVSIFNNVIYQYSLSTAWDITSASYDSKNFNLSSQDTFISSFFFKNDGTKLYSLGLGSGTRAYQYSLSTAWDVSTASYDSVNFSLVSEDNFAQGIFFKNDGTKFYLTGANTDFIYQYSLEPLPEKASLLMHHMQIAGQITN